MLQTKRAVKHLALFKFHPGTREEDIHRLLADLKELTWLIPGLVDFTAGPYSSPEGMNRGYTHAFIMTFESESARDAYLPHPEHERVKRFADGILESAIVFDFVV